MKNMYETYKNFFPLIYNPNSYKLRLSSNISQCLVLNS